MDDNTNIASFKIILDGFREDSDAKAVGEAVGATIQKLANALNLASLVGVTISYNYQLALNSVDRGFETSMELSPSSGDVIGVAMTVGVLRDGKNCAYIVFHAPYLEGILEPNSEDWLIALGIIAHECAHVSNLAALNKCFPGMLLTHRCKNIHDQLRINCWMAVIEEYCATRLSVVFDERQIDRLKDTFIKQAENLYDYVKDETFHNQMHRDVDLTLDKVYSAIASTLTLAAYYLGACAGMSVNFREGNEETFPSFEWLLPFIERLDFACDGIFERYGHWEGVDEMEVISDILDSIAVHLGVTVRETPKGIHVGINSF
ncbi:hypothetical protein [Citrobacter braakii]|uniref:hypothetical protein n=1 Tax=Citrobacter braakii TaxID=57706 RepID=UPI000542BFA6|nr:hypothetical protein [Citrobacter braakii]KHE05339.1 hypothetical protein IB70_16145 [Citrobacter braakii]